MRTDKQAGEEPWGGGGEVNSKMEPRMSMSDLQRMEFKQAFEEFDKVTATKRLRSTLQNEILTHVVKGSALRDFCHDN